jgi:hypothetical protein
MESKLRWLVVRNNQSRIDRQWGNCHLHGANRSSDACFSNDYRNLRYRRHQVRISIHHHYINGASASDIGIIRDSTAILNGG